MLKIWKGKSVEGRKTIARLVGFAIAVYAILICLAFFQPDYFDESRVSVDLIKNYIIITVPVGFWALLAFA